MLVRPHLVVRVAGLPVSSIESLRDPDLVRALATLADVDHAIQSARTSVSDALYATIGGVDDRAMRGALLQLRRALFQGTLPAPRALAAADTLLPSALRSRVREVVVRLCAREASEREVHRTYGAAAARARAALQHTASDPDFQKGLLLSSRTLFRNLARYQRTRADRVGSRDEQIERGLLRYLTRVVMKATPFARFCAIAEGVLDDAAGLAPGRASPLGQTFDADPARKRGHVRLDKRLYERLWSHLKRRPGVRAALVVEVNPTLAIVGERLHFLAVVGDREVFQRMTRGDALNAVLTRVAARSGEVTLGALAAALEADPTIEATADEVTTFLDALLDHGLLRFRSYVPEQVADWDIPLRAALDTVDDEHAQVVSSALADVRALAELYAGADVAERERLTDRIRARVLDALTALALPAESPEDLPLYEDASTAARLHVSRTPGVDGAFARLAEWVSLTQPIAYPRAEQATMRYFYDTYYGGAGRTSTAVPLLQFYEDFHREHLKTHLEKEALARRHAGAPTLAGYDLGNPFGLERVRDLQRAHARLTALVRARWLAAPNAEQVVLEPDAVREALTSAVVEHGSPAVCLSASVFCQLGVADARDTPATLVVPGGRYLVGFGKYFSRFLYMLPESLQRRVYADNAGLGGEAMVAEICGDGHFNANLHPPLLPWEISYPTGESGSRDGQIPSAELDVIPDPDDTHALSLRHRPTGARVFPVDLGFLNPRLRPPLYQLLTRFAPSGTFIAGLPQAVDPPASTMPGTEGDLPAPPPTFEFAPATRHAPTEPRVVYRPRIVYADCLVLARRQWTVPGSLTPRPTAAEADADYLLRVDRWRRAHGIPVEVYVRVIPESAAEATGPLAAGLAVVGAADRATESMTCGAGHNDSVTVSFGPNNTTSGGSAVDRPPPPASASPAGTYRGTGRPSRDWGKPQYIDFHNPLLVTLFGHMPGSLPAFSLQLEERYPEASALPTFEGEAYVTELILQLDFPASARRTSEIQAQGAPLSI